MARTAATGSKTKSVATRGSLGVGNRTVNPPNSRRNAHTESGTPYPSVRSARSHSPVSTARPGNHPADTKAARVAGFTDASPQLLATHAPAVATWQLGQRGGAKSDLAHSSTQDGGARVLVQFRALSSAHTRQLPHGRPDLRSGDAVRELDLSKAPQLGVYAINR
jgi:hypothetical protein